MHALSPPPSPPPSPPQGARDGAARAARALALVLASASALLAGGNVAAAARPTTAVRFGGPERRAYALEVACGPPAHARGLMGRAALPPRGGMLFVFDDEAVRSFWMKNTLLALDLIFVTEARRVAGVRTHAVPGDERPLSVAAPARYVVELAAGQVDAERIHVGQTVLFAQASALCPAPAAP